MEIWRLRLISTQVVVEVEVGVELGNYYIFYIVPLNLTIFILTLADNKFELSIAKLRSFSLVESELGQMLEIFKDLGSL